MSLTILETKAATAPRPDVIIIGSGIVGLASAFFAARQGMRVLILERMLAPTSLTSRRSGEGVRAQWELPHNIQIARESINLYENFGALLGDERQNSGYRPIGYLYASRTARGAADLAARVIRQREAGLDDVEYLDGPALRERAPLLAEDVVGGIIRQRDGVIAIDRIIAGYKSATNAEMLLGVDVLAIGSTASGAFVETHLGRFEAGAVVVAAGSKSGRLLAGFEQKPMMKVAKSTILRVKADGIPIDHPTTIDIDIGSFWRPDEGGARLTASFSHIHLVDEGVDDPLPEPDYLDRAFATAIPMTPRWKEWSASLLDSHLRTGTFSVTADGAPVIGPVPGAPGIFVNVGYGGHGVMMSPSGGRRLAAMLASGRDEPGNPFSVARFHDGQILRPEPMTIHVTD